VCFSRSGSIQYITWATNGNTSGVIYRSFDYGVTFTLVQGHIADGGYWRRIECDATGRFVYATRFNTITSQLYVYRSEDYGTTWAPFNSRGYEDVWVSATGQFVVIITNAWTWNLAPYNGIVVAYSRDYGRQDTFGLFSLGQTSTIQTINGSGDGSVLVLGSLSITQSGFPGTGFIRVARQGQQNIQDLSVVGGTISKASGTYTLTNDVVLWYSGVTTTTSDTASVYLDDFRDVRGKIDLTQFDIRYEMDILWNYTSVLYPQCWIGLGLNQVQASSVANPTQNNAQTTWTNLIQTTFTGMTPYDQVYTSRFFCGFSGEQGTGTAFRYRTTMKGNISLVTRQTPQFSNDPAMNSRLIQNDFECNSCLLQEHTTANQFKILSVTDPVAGQQTQRGVAVWEASYDNLWNLGSAGGNDLNSGVYRLYLRFTDTGTTNVFRGAQIRYSIYRVRK
jgi:hypothetical protein